MFWMEHNTILVILHYCLSLLLLILLTCCRAPDWCRLHLLLLQATHPGTTSFLLSLMGLVGAKRGLTIVDDPLFGTMVPTIGKWLNGSSMLQWAHTGKWLRGTSNMLKAKRFTNTMRHSNSDVSEIMSWTRDLCQTSSKCCYITESTYFE